jgi:hypothetical protein
MIRLSITTVLMVALLLTRAVPGIAIEERLFRLGYLDNPGSGLCRIAALKGHFSAEGLKVELIRFSDSRSGLAALGQGAIDGGAFHVGEGLRAIARDKGFRIIAGGGIPLATGPLAELDSRVQQESDLFATVVFIPAIGSSGEKENLTRLTAALIRAYRSSRMEPDLQRETSAGPDQTITRFDPSPEYYHLERLWHQLALQSPDMSRGFLADHVYEEIYCDALDRLLDRSPEDTLFKELSARAICVPDCCPKNRKTK